MNDCRRTIEQLTRYVDGELPENERAGVERHLGQCSPCRRAAAEEDGGRAAVKHGRPRLARDPLPPGLRTRCEALARESRAHSRPGWQHRLVATAASVLLVIATATLIFALATRRSDTLLAQQLTADHAKCFGLFGDPGVSVDARTAEQDLLHRYGWDVHVPPSSAPLGVTLIGARRCLYAAGTIPHVLYRVNGNDVSLFVLDDEGGRSADVVTLGHRSRIWSQGERTFVLVSSRPATLDGNAVRYLQAQMRQ